jgi:hypothetical protein
VPLPRSQDHFTALALPDSVLREHLRIKNLAEEGDRGAEVGVFLLENVTSL